MLDLSPPEFYWIFAESGDIICLEKIYKGVSTYAFVDKKFKLDEMFRFEVGGMCQGIVPDKYLKEYKKWLKSSIHSQQ